MELKIKTSWTKKMYVGSVANELWKIKKELVVIAVHTGFIQNV